MKQRGVAYLEGEKPVLLSSKDLINWETVVSFDIFVRYSNRSKFDI
jgi:hypothetical protein